MRLRPQLSSNAIERPTDGGFAVFEKVKHLMLGQHARDSS